MYSVVIPVYNAKSSLKRCVDSWLAQSRSDLELLLVDDGSTDGSAGLCDELADSDPRIRVIHQKNSGVSAARFRKPVGSMYSSQTVMIMWRWIIWKRWQTVWITPAQIWPYVDFIIYLRAQIFPRVPEAASGNCSILKRRFWSFTA